MDNSHVMVSVIIPTYNRKDDLSKAIRSVQKQTERNIEILVCDDGSTDGTKESVDEIIKKDARVRYFDCGHNGRPAIPRNVGIENSKGEWLAFLDDDDVWNPTKLEAQLFLMNKYDVKGSCTNAYFYEGDTNTGELYFLNSKDEKLSFGNFIDVNPVICSSMMFHKSLIKTCKGFPEEENLRAIEDYAFWLRIVSYTDIVYIHYPLVGYLKTSQSSIRNKKILSFKEQKALVFDNYRRWRKNNKDAKIYFIFCKECIKNRVFKAINKLIAFLKRVKRFIKSIAKR